ncbi:PKD domain-containing protein [Methanoplanus limicola]|uniref:PKD domain-containing protein n=1 Tax=Methanoplanus limicola TaxID=2315 RepID=UPI00373AE9E0
MWEWNFGDGCNSTSSEQNPVHCFQSSGIYNVSLFISNNFSSSNVTKEVVFVMEEVPEPGGSSHDDWPEDEVVTFDLPDSPGGNSLQNEKLFILWADDLKAYIYNLNSFDYTSENGISYIGDPENISIKRLNSDPACLDSDCPYYTYYISPEYCSFECYNVLTIVPGPEEWDYIQSGTSIEGIKWMNPYTGYWEELNTVESRENMSFSAKIENFGLYALFLTPKEPKENIQKVMSEIYTEETMASEAIVFVFMVFVLISGLVMLVIYDSHK